MIESQFSKLRERCGSPQYEIRDSASGLNEKRKGLKKLMDLAKEGKIDVIRVTQKDRLSRFGNKYLERYFKSIDVKIEVVFKEERKDLNEEHRDDFMSLIASFSGKFYRSRGLKSNRNFLKKPMIF